jgi:hypothetical protein
LALSCFSIDVDGVPIPIIDLAYLFSEEFNAFQQGSITTRHDKPVPGIKHKQG